MKFEDFLKLIYEIVSIILTLAWQLVKFIFNLFSNKEPEPKEPELNDRYQATFASVKDVLTETSGGWSLNGKLCVDSETACKGGICIGGTGSGKSVVITMPTAYSILGNSAVFMDTSGEIEEYTAGFYQMNDHRTLFLDVKNPQRSVFYNPLKRVKTVSDAQKVALILSKSKTDGQIKKGEDFWEISSMAFLTMLILLTCKQEEQYRNITNLKFLVDNFSTGKLDELVAKSGNRFIISEYKNFLAMDQKVISSVIATARTTLNLWNSEEIQLITSDDTIGDFKDFRKECKVLYIQAPTLQVKYYSPLINLFFEQFFDGLMQERPEEGEHCCFFLLDEFSSLFINSIELAVSNLRKYNSNVFLMVQSENQISNIYGENVCRSLMQNLHCKVFFSGQDAETCKRLSTLIGKREFEIEDPETGFKEKRVRELLTPDEIYTLGGKNRALIFVGQKALFTNMYPFFNDKTYKRYSEIPAEETETNNVLSEVPLLKL